MAPADAVLAQEWEALAPAGSHAGTTGLIHMPSAQVLPEGSVEARADNFWNRRYLPNTETGYDTGFGIGLLPGFELSGRIANYDMAKSQRLRDLSINAKWQLPRLFDAQPDLAIGATDFGGAAPHFRSVYGVATQQWGPLNLTLGRGQGPDQFNGWFGGVQAALPFQGWSALAEHDSRDKFVGLRYVSPGWAALGDARLIGTLSRSINARDSAGARADRTEVGLSLQIPLGRNTRSASRSAGSGGTPSRFTTAPAASVIHWQAADGSLSPMVMPSANGQVEASAPAMSSRAVQGLALDARTGTVMAETSSTRATVLTPEIQAALAEAREKLIAAGLDHVRVGASAARAPGAQVDWVATMESALYTRNDADAVGVALGVLADGSKGLPVGQLVVVVERAGLPVYHLSVDRNAWAAYLETDDGAAVRASLSVKPGNASLPTEIQWQAPEAKRQDQVRLSMGLRYAAYYATEVGIYDYSVAPALTAHVPLWRGAEVAVTRVMAPVESRNFNPGFVFAGTGIRSGWSSATLNQSWWLGPRWLNVTGAGRLFYDHWGIQHESVLFLPWNEDSLRGRFTRTRRASDAPVGGASQIESAQVTYRLQMPSLQGYAELHWNQYLSGDRGPSVDFRRFFGDFQFGLTLRSSERDKFAGLTVEVPLAPIRGWRSGGGFSISTDRVFQTAVMSRVGNTHNSVKADATVLTGYEYNLTNLILNRNRWQRAYFLQQLPRLKAAYEAEVSTLQATSVTR